MSEGVPLIDIRPDHWEIVRDILKKHVPQYAVWAFGSRAKWHAKPYSDLDLAIITDKPLSLAVSAALADDFSESDLPWKVDVVDWATISASFREIIERDKVVVQEGSESVGMGDEWLTVRIEDIAEKIAMGPFGSNIKVETFVATGVPVISGAHLRNVRLEDGSFNFVTAEHAERMKNSNVFRGDVIFTHAGNIGQVAYIPPNSQYGRYVISQRQFYLRCDLSKADPAFVSYFFHSPEGQHKLLANASQTGVPSIARPSSYLKTIELSLPPLTEQRAIAHILGTLDDKIELNRRRNQTLEAMARALFKDWFVDFGPVRAKMKGREPYLPADLWQHFPGRLDADGKPEGWESGRLDDALVLQRGFDLPASARTHGMYPVMAASGINGYHDKHMAKGPGITTGRSGILGRVFLVQSDFWPLNTSLWVKEFKRVSPFYAFELLRGLDFEMFNAGSAVPTLNRNHVHNLPIFLPPRQLIDSFDEQVMPMRTAQQKNEDECELLAQLRDTLLPKLISGELRVPGATRMAREVA